MSSDQIVVLASLESASAYPDALRKVTYVDTETSKRLVLLTNNFALPAATIAAIYKQCWKMELFFKWIKLHLRIKAFYGTSENAVSVYVLVAIARKKLNAEASLYQILQVLSLTLLEIPHFTGTSADRLPRRFTIPLQENESVLLIAGQQ